MVVAVFVNPPRLNSIFRKRTSLCAGQRYLYFILVEENMIDWLCCGLIILFKF